MKATLTKSVLTKNVLGKQYVDPGIPFFFRLLGNKGIDTQTWTGILNGQVYNVQNGSTTGTDADDATPNSPYGFDFTAGDIMKGGMDDKNGLPASMTELYISIVARMDVLLNSALFYQLFGASYSDRARVIDPDFKWRMKDQAGNNIITTIANIANYITAGIPFHILLRATTTYCSILINGTERGSLSPTGVTSYKTGANDFALGQDSNTGHKLDGQIRYIKTGFIYPNAEQCQKEYESASFFMSS